MDRLAEKLIAIALEQGFILAGFATLRPLEERAGFFSRWLAEGRAAGMEWLAKTPAKRLDPRLIDPRLRSMMTLAWPYIPPRPPAIDWRAEMRGRIAAYALGLDYHDTVKARALTVAAAIAAERPGAVTRVYVDTGPVFEREWAAAAGLGWFGRNTNLLNRYHGSYFFLAEILTDLGFDAPEAPYRDHCGTCRRCLDLCPTGALADGHLLEPRLCISYLTIEHRGAIPRAMRPRLGNWIFGCDICQEVCPWNNDATAAAPINEALMPPLAELLALDDDGFRRRFAKSAIRRAKRSGLLRNAAVALGNSGNPAAIAPLAATLANEPDAQIRAHAAWALGRFDAADARRALEQARRGESAPEVNQEIALAIERAP